MRHSLLLLALLTIGIGVMAAPLKNIEIRLTQPDGQIVNCYASGDEYYNYLHDANGFTIVKGDNGYYVYATKDANGKVMPSAYVVNSIDPASVGLKPYVKISEQEYYARRHEREQHLRKPQARNGKELNHGRYNNLVVFIRFAGDTYHNTPFSTVEAMFNADSYDANSLHNYYHHTSYNQLDLWSYFYPQPEGETILSYEDIYPKQYYQPYDPVTNPMGYQEYETAEREFSLLERAINYIEDMVPEDLNLDYNEDGLVDNVVFVIKGEPGEWASLLWPHRWCIYDRYVPLHNLQVFDFNLQLEQGGMFNVSTLCHEMFHSLGAPDLYHYSGGVDPVGAWDLMCGTTEPPQQTSTYMKYKYGNWVEEIPIIHWEELGDQYTFELEPVSWEGGRRNGYMIPVSNEQYFFVEYRDKNNLFENKIPGSGLLIYRIDTRFDGNASWNGTDSFDEVYLFRPGGTPDEIGNLDQAFFSEQSGRTSFNYGTDPYPFINNQPYQFYDPGFEITNISATGDRMSFDVLPYGGEFGGPLVENLTAHVNSMEHQVELSWSSIEGTDYYKVYHNGSELPSTTDTTYVIPYTESDNGYNVYSVMSVSGGMMHIYHALTHTWAILGNYESIDLAMTSDSPYGTKGGELEVSFSNPDMKTQHFTLYDGDPKTAELLVPANTEVTFNWLSGFDPDGNGIRVSAVRHTTHGEETVFDVDSPRAGILATYTVPDEGMSATAPRKVIASEEGSDIRLKWIMSTELNSFNIYRDGRLVASEVNGYEYLDNQLLRSGTYNYQVEGTSPSYTTWHPENALPARALCYYCEPPQNLSGTHTSNQNELRWEAPQFMGYGMLAYDNNHFEESFGSTNQKWGIKFEPDQLAFFEGRPLAYLEMFDCTAVNYTFKIYNGSLANNSTLLHTQQHEMTGSQEWVRFALDENVSYDPTLPLWISVNSSGVSNPIPCCSYVNHDNSCLVISGNNWKPVTDYHINYSWMLRAYTTSSDLNGDITYNLYWGNEESLDHQMMLGMEHLAVTSVVHNSNADLRYNVTAVIDGRETDFSNSVFLGPTVALTETAEPTDDHFARIGNRNIYINNIDNNTILQIIDMTGRVTVLRGNRMACVPTDGMACGVYVLRLINGNDVKTQKIMLR